MIGLVYFTQRQLSRPNVVHRLAALLGVSCLLQYILRVSLAKGQAQETLVPRVFSSNLQYL